MCIVHKRVKVKFKTVLEKPNSKNEGIGDHKKYFISMWAKGVRGMGRKPVVL